MREKIKANYTSKDFYKHFKDKHPKIKISKSEYIEILKEYFDEIMDMVIFKSMQFYFPGRLGNLKILQYKQDIKLLEDGSLDKRRLRPNWKDTKDMWKRIYPDKTWEEILSIKKKPIIYHENKHSNGYNYKWYWDNTTSNVPNHTAYKLDITRSHDRRLAKAVKNPDLDLYYHIKHKE